MAVVAALLLACAALLLLLALGALSLPGASDGAGPRGAGLARPRPRARFRRSATESCVFFLFLLSPASGLRLLDLSLACALVWFPARC